MYLIYNSRNYLKLIAPTVQCRQWNLIYNSRNYLKLIAIGIKNNIKTIYNSRNYLKLIALNVRFIVLPNLQQQKLFKAYSLTQSQAKYLSIYNSRNYLKLIATYEITSVYGDIYNSRNYLKLIARCPRLSFRLWHLQQQKLFKAYSHET